MNLLISYHKSFTPTFILRSQYRNVNVLCQTIDTLRKSNKSQYDIKALYLIKLRDQLRLITEGYNLGDGGADGRMTT